MKILYLFFAIFLINTIIINCQVGTWILLDSIDFQPSKKELFCYDKQSCLVYYRFSNIKNCNVLKTNTQPLNIWDLIMNDCDGLRYDSIKGEYYQYYPEEFRSIYLLPNNKIIALQNNSVLKISEDIAKTWKTIIIDSFLITNKYFTNLIKSKNDSVFLCYSPFYINNYSKTYKRLFYSLNQGTNWIEVNFPMNSSLSSIVSISIPTNKHIYIFSQYKLLCYNFIYSDDFGKSWQEKEITFDTLITKETSLLSSFIDENNGWFCLNIKIDNVYKTKIYRTRDRGINWVLISELPFNTSHFKFINNEIGFITNTNQGYKTLDSGRTWLPIIDINGYTFPRRFQKYEFVDGNCFMALSNDGTLFRYEFNNTNIETLETDNKNNFKLVYNPITQIIIINYKNGSLEPVNIKLFNLYGNLLEEKTFSECLEGATYELDVSNYPLGIYFISCTVGGITEIKKVCIIR